MKKYIFKLYPFETETPNKDDSLLPVPIRCLIVGGSGSGKTTLLRNIITEYWVDYQHLYVFSKNLEQPVYKILQKIFDINFNIDSHFSDQDIVPVDGCQTNSLVVFDDWILEKDQSLVKEYFVRGRHKNISCIYLTHCFSSSDLKLIRNNLKFLFIFKQQKHYVSKIWESFYCSTLSKEKFEKFCAFCWEKKYGYISLDVIDNHIYNKLEKKLC